MSMSIMEKMTLSSRHVSSLISVPGWISYDVEVDKDGLGWDFFNRRVKTHFPGDQIESCQQLIKSRETPRLMITNTIIQK